MEFQLNNSLEILEKTPSILEAFLSGLSEEWLMNNEGTQTWSPYQIVAHLIIGEKTDWMVRTKAILSSSTPPSFESFDRFAHLQEEHLPISRLLEEFKALRTENLKELKGLNLSLQDLKLTGLHPELGEVTLAQLIATWTVHDLGHLAQISRVLSKQYKTEVGPWVNYLSILSK